MRCPSCDAEVPEGDYVCGECGAYAYRDVPAVPRETTPEVDDSVVGSGPRLPSRKSLSKAAQAGPVIEVEQQPSSRPGPGQSPYSPGPGGPDFSYPPINGWPGLAPEPTPMPSPKPDAAPLPRPLAGGRAIGGSIAAAGTVDQEELRRRGRTMGKWSIGLAIAAVLIPLVGPVGIVTGYFAWRLGETRLGRLGVVLSIVAMVVGLALTIAVVPPQQR